MTSPTAPQQPAPRRTSTASTVAIVTAVAGGVALAAVGISSATHALLPWSGLPLVFAGPGGFDDDAFAGGDDGRDGRDGRAVAGPGEEATASVDRIVGLEIDAAAADFTLAFGDVDEAVLAVERGDGRRDARWTIGVDDDRELVVERAGNCGFGCGGPGPADRVTLTLPERLSERGALRGDLALSGGELRASGAFAQLDLEVAAGRLVFDGEAAELDVDLQAGEVELDVAEVRRAGFEVEVGTLRATLTGAAPAEVGVEASTGRVDLRLPDAAYRVDARSELGRIDDRLRGDDASDHRVTVRSELAEVTLR